MSVKRYDIEAYLYYDDCRWETAESVDGDFVYASDYDELRERVEWMLECDDCPLRNSTEPEKWGFEALWETRYAARKAVEELL